METLEQVKQSYDEHRKLLTSTDMNGQQIEAWAEKSRNYEAKIKGLKRTQELNQLNAKFDRIREFAKIAFELELPAEDITCMDGSLHSGKLKKYPHIAALKASHYIQLTWSNEIGGYEIVRLDGHKFRMYESKYEDRKTTYKKINTFEKFCEENLIPLNPISEAIVEGIETHLKSVNDELQEAIKKHSKAMDMLGAHKYNVWGVLRQDSNEHLHPYRMNI